jgi:hypothetical protein
MFNTFVIKNASRAKIKKIHGKSIQECSEIRPDQRTMPYFEVVTEQVLSDKRYLGLSDHQQGAFWRLIIHVMAPDCGITVRHPGAIAGRLGISIEAWEKLERVLLDNGMLTITADACYLMQYEFREQYLQTLE